MKTLKLGSSGSEVKVLCAYLEVPERVSFDSDLKSTVIEYQKQHGLDPDGIVGYNTWKSLLIGYRLKHNPSGEIKSEDYQLFGSLYGVSPAALKAVVKVETGGTGGFLSNGKPKILFEGHVFWSELKKVGIDPGRVQRGNEDVLYRSWNRSKYKGGTGEWTRLEKAMKIHKEAALKSASWGLFQIMGNNYKKTSAKSVVEFTERMADSEFQQLLLGLEFIYGSGLMTYLQTLDWKKFAYRYNGSGYAQNSYDTKLKAAYLSYCK